MTFIVVVMKGNIKQRDDMNDDKTYRDWRMLVRLLRNHIQKKYSGRGQCGGKVQSVVQNDETSFQ